MQEILYHYQPPTPTTWAYLSSLIIIAVYFKFRRFWSVRNLDLVGLILFAPGLLPVSHALDLAGRRSADVKAEAHDARGSGNPTSPPLVDQPQKANDGKEK